MNMKMLHSLTPVLIFAAWQSPAFSQSCTGLCTQQQTCPSGGTTSVSGIVYAPNGTTPLPNVAVYVPNGGAAPSYGVQAFTAGVSCSQQTVLTGSPLTITWSAVDGTFTLNNVPVGSNIPLVIQAGKWRAKFSIPTVAACTTTALPASLTSLPSTHIGGDPANNIPLVAVVTGMDSTLECLLKRAGIQQSEFTDPATQGGAGRIRFYIGEGYPGVNIDSATPSATQLWSGATPDINQYDFVIFGCQGSPFNKTAAQQAVVINYANSGGRVITEHASDVWLMNPTPNTTPNPFGNAPWTPGGAAPTKTQTATIDYNTNPEGQLMAQWLQKISGGTVGQISLPYESNELTSSPAYSQMWLSLSNGTPMEFATAAPVGPVTGTITGCGRVQFNNYHVEPMSSLLATMTSLPTKPYSTFPKECPTTPMTPVETYALYSLFDMPTLYQQNVSFTSNAPATAANGASFTVAATVSIGVTFGVVPSVVFTSAGACTNSGATYTMTSGSGTCSVIANAPGDYFHLAAAPQVTQTVTATAQ